MDSAKNAKKGIVFVIASAFIFGFTPILTRMTYDEGANSVTMVFLRAVLAAPLLFAIMKIRKIPFAVSRAEAHDLLLSGFSFAVTVILMYNSYAYIPVGEAVTLHFIYPTAVSLGCVLFYKEKLTKTIIIALILSIAGVSMFSGNMSFDNMKSGGSLGFMLALASGFTFAFYMIYVDKSSLRQIPTTKISFAISITAAFCSGIYGLGGFGGGLTFGLSAKGWLYAWIVALLVSFVAISLLQAGIKYVGAPTAAILSTFEPITSVLCGTFFLGESFSLLKVIGCACIIASVILVAMGYTKTPAQNT